MLYFLNECTLNNVGEEVKHCTGDKINAKSTANMNLTSGVKCLTTKLHRGKEFDICPKKSVTIIS